MHLATLLFAFAGFAALCLAMDKHQPDLVGHRLAATNIRWLRGAAIAVLAAAYASAAAVSGWRFGVVEWIGAIMVAALGLTLLLPYRPRWIVRLAMGGGIAGVMICAFATFAR